MLVTGLRLVVAACMPLSADEAYYWVWSHALAPGYLDHPPMVALWIWAGTHLAGQTALGVRLLGPLSALAGSLLLVSAGRDLAPGRGAGTRAAWMLNATLALNAGAVIMTPDTPLLFFWSAVLACAARLVRTGDGRWWLAAGLCAGGALVSKYTALLLAPVLLLWLVTVPEMRVWLRRWQLYAGGVAALLVFLPVLAWNAAHGFASLAKQGGREGDFAPAHAAQFLLELVGGQIGLATPLLFGVFCAGVWVCARRFRRPAEWLVAASVVVPAAVFLAHALGDRVQANWPGVLYPGAALAAGLAFTRVWRPAVWLGAVLSALVFAQGAWAPLALPRWADFTLIRLGGWQALARDAAAQARAQGAAFLVADEYGLAAELAFYQNLPVVAAEPRWAFFALPAASAEGGGLLLRTARRAHGPDPALWPGATLTGTLTRARGGVTAETYSFYKIDGARLRPPAVLLPD